MRVLDNSTHELLGYLSEISLKGFKLESPKVIPIHKGFTLRLEYTSEVEDKPYIVFIARAVWIQPDPVIPNEYIVGFRIVDISPSEQEIYKDVVEKYGPPKPRW